MTLVKFNADNSNNKRALMPSLNNVFDSIFADNFFADRNMAMVPAVNICETAENFQIELAAPGLAKEDFKINLDRKLLSIAVDKQMENEQEGKSFSRKEFGYNAFTRSFTLPDSADENRIQAKYTNGILHLEIAKREDAKMTPRQISIS